MKDIDKRIKESQTSIFKAVFPNTTNQYDTLFGGTALHLMNEVAFICATRFFRKKVVTVIFTFVAIGDDRKLISII